jgi:hypothetical protein
MFDDILKALTEGGVSTTTNTLENIAMQILFTLVIGLVISFTYKTTVSFERRSESVSTTLLLLPSIVGVVVALIGNNIAGAFSLAGIFSIIKYRSATTNAKDILFVLFCAATGLACGVRAYGIGLLVALILCAVLFIAAKLKVDKRTNSRSLLKILVPEDMNAEEAFDEVLGKYATKFELLKMRTKDLGSLFELTYVIVLSPAADKKRMIDELRILNGNLNINLDSYNLTSEF